jgi:hypothetical protein
MSAVPGSGPRWPRDRWISPTTLNNYRNCPYRVRLRHLDKVPEPYVYDVTLAKGRIAHLALKRIADALCRGQGPIDDAEVMKMARVHLPRQEYPSEEMRMTVARDIVRWVQFGRRYIERIPDPAWVLIEKNLNREWRIFPGIPPYTVMARPDVVLRRSDENDQPLFEIIDYKTGKRRPEDMPPVIMRFVARDLLQGLVGDASAAQVRFTYLWLDSGEKDVKDLSVEFCTHHWEDISGDLAKLASESDWKPTPSFLCNYCPYHKKVCNEKIPAGDSSGW